MLKSGLSESFANPSNLESDNLDFRGRPEDRRISLAKNGSESMNLSSPIPRDIPEARGRADDRRVSMTKAEAQSSSGRRDSREGNPLRKRSRSPRPISAGKSPEVKRYKASNKSNTVWEAGFFNFLSRRRD